MTGKQRAYLRKLANPLDAIFQVGKNGINDELIRQVDETLTKRELIKLRVLETAPIKAREAADLLSAATNSHSIQVIGMRFVLYRENKQIEKEKRILLPV